MSTYKPFHECPVLQVSGVILETTVFKGARTNDYRFDRISGDCLKLLRFQIESFTKLPGIEQFSEVRGITSRQERAELVYFYFPLPLLIALLKISTICDDSSIY
jgi:hypothetical protein